MCYCIWQYRGLLLSFHFLFSTLNFRRRTIGRLGHAVFIPRRVPLIVLILVALLLYYQQMPISNFVYFLLPLYVVTIVINVILLTTPNLLDRQNWDTYFSKINKQKIIQTLFYNAIFSK